MMRWKVLHNFHKTNRILIIYNKKDIWICERRLCALESTSRKSYIFDVHVEIFRFSGNVQNQGLGKNNFLFQ